MATITDQLANDARCYDRCIPDGMQQSVLISLLAKLLRAFNPAADVTTTTLLREARCYNRCIPPGEEGGVMIYLLSQIQVVIGGGGGGAAPGVLWIYWQAAHVDDNPPANPTFAYMRRFLNGDPPVIWNPDTALWL